MRWFYHWLMYHYCGWQKRRALNQLRKWAADEGRDWSVYSDDDLVEALRDVKRKREERA